MSAEGLNVRSTPAQPIVISDGFHCSDLGAPAGIIDPTIGALHVQALASMKNWLATYKAAEVPEPRQTAKASVSEVPQGRALRAAHEKPISGWLRGAGRL